jgi:ATP adenylyltransferase
MPRVFPFLDRTGADPSINGEQRPWDRVLFETDHFLVVPTVGALVEGWLLVVTKQQYMCMGAVDSEMFDELKRLKNYISLILHRHYGDVVVFEHGPHEPAERVGCGVDHAHLHVVPLNFDLLDAVPAVSNATLEWRAADGFQAAGNLFNARTPYLYVEQPVGNPKIAAAWDAPSQLFRRVIAQSIGSPGSFDWRTNPMELNVVSTIETVRGSFSSEEFSNDAEFVTS